MKNAIKKLIKHVYESKNIEDVLLKLITKLVTLLQSKKIDRAKLKFL